MNFKTISVLLAIVTAVCAQATTNPYELKDGDGKTCLRADMALTIQVNYTKSNQQEPAIFQWALPEYNATDPSTVVVGGSCAANGTAELTLSTPAGSTSVSMTFTMEGDQTYLSGVELSYTEDPDVFVNTTKPNNNVTVTKTDLKEFEAPAGKAYKCNNEGSLPLDEAGALLNLADVKVQAFGYNNTFGDVKECEADMTTTPAGNSTINPNATTIMPTTKPPPTTPTPKPEVPPQNNYTLTSDGKVCLMALMALQIEANYTKTDGKEGSAKWNVPANPAVSGTCGNDTSVLTLTYDGTASNITITFTRSGANGLLQDDGKFMASAIAVVYTETSARFPETNSSGVVRTVSSTNLTAFEGSVGSSYKCMAEQDVTLSDTVMLIATDVQVQPFGLTDNNFDTAEECPADNEISNIVPIAVGCALAGLVVIVLIAYLIGRRKSHKGYQQV
ncbi:PREDICTED: lysosome-associated membrane glycoprotein 1-like [Branchiostoma belcheri]|uniref:Lysosome-associated membrane glycoprotein 1-like n=1 Tax=Branchiostoma belcheri TaxID=7741 RepID=A0A6P4ZZL2_BRABE|nr:PREDICTED: lysosome-associated membrane glycoprotein 1-like [Branchiostoma belcheri]